MMDVKRASKNLCARLESELDALNIHVRIVYTPARVDRGRRDQCGHADCQGRTAQARHHPRAMSGAEVIKARAAKERAQMATSVVSAYHRGLGHKTIAKELGFSPRRVRTVLIEQGVYKPGSLFQTPAHKARAVATQSKARKVCPYRHSRLAFTEERRILQAQERQYEKAWRKEGHRHDPCFRIIQVLRSRLRKVAQRGRGYGGNSLAWLGCTPLELRAHIERRWRKRMTWANFGRAWHIDHILPCASFDMTQEDQRKRCFHYTNLRPLWARANHRKGSAIPKAHQWELL